MTNSHFANSHGLPDPEQYVFARDMATLAKARLIEDTPEEGALLRRKPLPITTLNNTTVTHCCGIVALTSMASKPAIPLKPATAW